MKDGKKVTGKVQARAKAEYFCAYQERSQQEVRNKLYDLGLHSADVEELISDLIQANFLNEERFAISYTLGKFRIKHWGKYKIKQGLKLKQVPPKLIEKALKQIDGDEYLHTLKSLLQKKILVLSEPVAYKLNYKLTQYAVTKGYERDLVADLLKDPDWNS